MSEHDGLLNRGPLEHYTFRVKTRSFVYIAGGARVENRPSCPPRPPRCIALTAALDRDQKDLLADSMLRLVAHVEPLVERFRVESRTNGGGPGRTRAGSSCAV